MSTPDLRTILLGPPAAFYEREAIARFLELKGYPEAAAAVVLDFEQWKKEERANGK